MWGNSSQNFFRLMLHFMLNIANCFALPVWKYWTFLGKMVLSNICSVSFLSLLGLISANGGVVSPPPSLQIAAAVLIPARAMLNFIKTQSLLITCRQVQELQWIHTIMRDASSVFHVMFHWCATFLLSLHTRWSFWKSHSSGTLAKQKGQPNSYDQQNYPHWGRRFVRDPLCWVDRSFSSVGRWTHVTPGMDVQVIKRALESCHWQYPVQ